MCGLTGIWEPEGWPEPEIGWIMLAGFEGKGIAFEAATAARNHAYNVWNMAALTSNIMPGNTRSVALAERLGATLDPQAAQPKPDAPILVYRHPKPEVRQ